jgi:hypothetical protein
MDTTTRDHAFATMETTREALKAWVVTHTGEEAARTLVAFEACDAAGWVYDLLAPLGVARAVVNCNDERWRWRKVKRKTDRDDALKLARLTLIDQEDWNLYLRLVDQRAADIIDVVGYMPKSQADE